MTTYASLQYNMLLPGVTICFSQVALTAVSQCCSTPLYQIQCSPELQEARHAALLILVRLNALVRFSASFRRRIVVAVI